MGIRIGHASQNENKKANGGKPGDQNKHEVLFRSWYQPSSKWDYVLRPITNEIAEKSAKFVEDVCVNNRIGYDQMGNTENEGRNSLYKQAKKVKFDASKIKVACECDCSSLMHCASIAGGANLTYGSNGLTTRTMVDGYRQSGDYTVLNDSKYLTSDKYLRRGDILVNVGSHTVMALEDGELAYDKLDNKFTPYIAKTVSDLNLRSSATSANITNIITVIPKNSYVYVLKHISGVWVQVNVIVKNKSYYGYVSRNYLSKIDIDKNEQRKVTAGGLNARTGQGTLYPKVFTMNKNDIFTIIFKDKWGLILFDNKLGYANISDAYSKKI